ncbi:MAG: hypothetical protein LAO07_13075 [Acidobacteriia bacterium]|nr:hypothetical protein [Terriglobia bacterium]
MLSLRRRSLAFLAVAVCLAARTIPLASQEPTLTEDQIKQFLLKAKVKQSKQTAKGITAPSRVTLSDGTLTHDAAFQPIDEHKSIMQLASGTEINFRDSYHFDIAGYELAKLLGLGDMVPVTVERRMLGNTGALSWWVTAKMDEMDRNKQKLQSPDVNAWNKQLNKMWVFSQLIYDTDRNQTNILITQDWKLFMIDFTRAFRIHHKLEDPKRLVMCDRQLLEKLRQLDKAQVLEKTKPHLTKSEVEAVMARRDLIVTQFERLIAEKGEEKVIY